MDIGLIRELLFGERLGRERLPVWRPLFAYTVSDLSETEAVAVLAPVVAAHPRAAQASRSHLQLERRQGDGYELHRAARLLALALGHPPPAIDHADRERFEAERRLGALPLEEAFAVLGERDPRLRELATAAQSGSVAADRARALVGPEAEEATGVAATRLALRLTLRYLGAVSGTDGWSLRERAYDLSPADVQRLLGQR